MNIQVNVTTKYTSVWKTCVLLKNKKAKKKKKGINFVILQFLNFSRISLMHLLFELLSHPYQQEALCYFAANQRQANLYK